MKIISLLSVLIFNYFFCQTSDSVSVAFQNCKIEEGDNGVINLYGKSYEYSSKIITSRIDTQVKMYLLKPPKIRKKKHSYEVKVITHNKKMLDSLYLDIESYWDNLLKECKENGAVECDNFDNIPVTKGFFLISDSTMIPYIMPKGMSQNIGASIWICDSKKLYIITALKSNGGAGLISLFERNVLSFRKHGENKKWSKIKNRKLLYKALNN